MSRRATGPMSPAMAAMMAELRQVPRDDKEARLRVIKLASGWKPCEPCGGELAANMHYRSRRLWEGRLERAGKNDGTDPVSGESAERCEAHIAAIDAPLIGSLTPHRYASTG